MTDEQKTKWMIMPSTEVIDNAIFIANNIVPDPMFVKEQELSNSITSFAAEGYLGDQYKNKSSRDVLREMISICKRHKRKETDNAIKMNELFTENERLKEELRLVRQNDFQTNLFNPTSPFPNDITLLTL